MKDKILVIASAHSKLIPKALVLLLFVLIGFVTLRVSHAATFAISSEAETGLLSGNTTTAAGSGASGNGKNVAHFGPANTDNSQNLYGMSDGGTLQGLSSASPALRLDGYKSLGVQWVRSDMDWNVVQAGGRSSFDWTVYDQVVDAIRSRGMQDYLYWPILRLGGSRLAV